MIRIFSSSECRELRRFSLKPVPTLPANFIARRSTRIAQVAQRVDRVGEIEEAAGVYAETKIEELAERKLRFHKPELAQEWDKIQRRERQASVPKIVQGRSLEEDLAQNLTLSRTLENE